MAEWRLIRPCLFIVTTTPSTYPTPMLLRQPPGLLTRTLVRAVSSLAVCFVLSSIDPLELCLCLSVHVRAHINRVVSVWCWLAGRTVVPLSCRSCWSRAEARERGIRAGGSRVRRPPSSRRARWRRRAATPCPSRAIVRSRGLPQSDDPPSAGLSPTGRTSCRSWVPVHISSGSHRLSNSSSLPLSPVVCPPPHPHGRVISTCLASRR